MTEPTRSGPILARFDRPVADRPTTIAVLADAHLSPRERGTWKVFHRTERTLRVAVDSVNAHDVDGVLFAGDLTKDGALWEYDRFDEIVADLEPPAVAIPGNHDLPRTADDHESPSLADFEERYAPEPFPFVTRFGGVDLVGLNSNAATYDRPAKSFEGAISDEEIDALDDRLAALDDPLVSIHHNLPGARQQYDRWRTELPVESGSVPDFPDTDRLVEVLSAHDVPLVLTGHLHVPTVARTGGVRELSVPALSSFPNAYTLLEIDERGTTARLVGVLDREGLVESYAHGAEKDRVVLSAVALAGLPLADDWR